MLRMYLLHCWSHLSDEGVDYAFLKFMGISFPEEQVPDATTLLHFRCTMEELKIGEQSFCAISYIIEQSGHMILSYCREVLQEE